MESGVHSNTKICTQHSVRKKIRRIAGAFCISFLLLGGAFTSHAQSGTDYAVHANIIYHFTKYINWPEDKKSGDFVIGIVGESPLFDKLKLLFSSNKSVGGQRIVLRRYQPSSRTFDCHILFIGDDESSSLKKIASGTAASSILLVTESDGLARKGSCINFVIIDDRLKLEINKKNIQDRDLEIATELLNLGTVVK
jgi:hypothetical protein